MYGQEEKEVVDLASLTREMVTPAQRRALTKEGYKIIGSHSAVKLCRWTKNQLRGRGGCYKHTFYGCAPLCLSVCMYECVRVRHSLSLRVAESRRTSVWRRLHHSPVQTSACFAGGITRTLWARYASCPVVTLVVGAPCFVDPGVALEG